MEKQQSISNLISLYAGKSSCKTIAITYGNGINAIPDDVPGIRLRYVRLPQKSPVDLADLADADCAIIDILKMDSDTKNTLHKFLTGLRDNQDCLLITEATSVLDSELVQLMDQFRPRLIVTENRINKCA